MNPVRHHEIVILNIEELDVVELQRRLEMSVAYISAGACGCHSACICSSLNSCGTFCGSC